MFGGIVLLPRTESFSQYGVMGPVFEERGERDWLEQLCDVTSFVEREPGTQCKQVALATLCANRPSCSASLGSFDLSDPYVSPSRCFLGNRGPCTLLKLARARGHRLPVRCQQVTQRL